MSVDLTVDDHVAVVTINRPERHNSLDPATYRGLSEAWTRVRDDNDIHVAIITGAGDRAFSTGIDLESGTTTGWPFGASLSEFWNTQEGMLLNRGLEIWKPVIGAVNGHCWAGGLTLLLATDLRVASERATFGLLEVTRGFIPGNGGSQRILDNLPYAVAMEVLLLGERMSAQRALQFGLVNAVVPQDKVMEKALDWARRLKKNAPLALQATKEAAIRSRGMDLNTGLRYEQAIARLLLFTEDSREGPAAFNAQRAADYQGQ